MPERKAKKLKEDIRKLLPYAKVIFAREKEGKKSLESLGIKDVKLSTDLVLQSKGFNAGQIMNGRLPVEQPAVCIIPNTQCVKRGTPERIFGLV